MKVLEFLGGLYFGFGFAYLIINFLYGVLR